jgi:hypothetical protein
MLTPALTRPAVNHDNARGSVGRTPGDPTRDPTRGGPAHFPFALT